MSGPPELPLLSAAFVWIRLMVRSLTVRSRLIAETMPSVMVPRSAVPSGSPMAATLSPTCRTDESPNSAACSPSASIFRTARSLVSSLPMIDAVYSRLSAVRTLTACALSIT